MLPSLPPVAVHPMPIPIVRAAPPAPALTPFFLASSLPSEAPPSRVPAPEGFSAVVTADEFDLPSDAASAESAFDQVNSVAQLTDVQPSDWAFQALQSLVERYGCMTGYPNRTFRGDRPEPLRIRRRSERLSGSDQ